MIGGIKGVALRPQRIKPGERGGESSTINTRGLTSAASSSCQNGTFID